MGGLPLKQRNRIILITCILLITAGIQPLQAADIYQWTDENGKVHFGDRPPRGQQAQNISKSANKVNVDSSGAEREKLGNIFAPLTPEEEAYQKQQSQTDANQQAALKQNCNEAQQELKFFKTKRFYWVDEAGNTKNATEAERQAKIKELTDLITKYCG